MIDLDNPDIKFAIHAVRRASQLVQLVQDELVASSLTKDDRSPVTVADFASQAIVASMLAETFPDDLIMGEEDSRALRADPATLQLVTGFVRRFIPKTDPDQVCTWIDRGSATPLPGGAGERLVSQRSGEATPLPGGAGERLVSQRSGEATPLPGGAEGRLVSQSRSRRSRDRDGEAATASRFWTLDPIDGTKGFLRGDQYAVALALVVGGKVQVGVLGCPKLSDAYRPDYAGPGTLVVAARGQGTWWTPLNEGDGPYTRLHVSSQNDPSQARLLRSFEAGHTDVGKIDDLIRLLSIRAEAVRMDSQAKYAVLAAGQGELLLRLLSPSQPDYKEKIWDQAAGALVLEEAGGVITDLDGKPLDFTAGRTLVHNRGVLASNGVLHAKAVETLKRLNV